MLRRVDEIKSKKMKNVKYIEVLDKKRLRVVFNNTQELILKADIEDYGYDSGLYIEKDTM